ncbi:hypothetical protein Daus18300_011337 [Diaporthe australafricana]|uniref:F-box domain-containing protein n=1 Tax=Diaporthe australafricana TaxID=127596 RepID=A0ABR3W6W3_9PEZI
MSEFLPFPRLPPELRLIVFNQARPIPGAHFLKAYRNYNTSIHADENIYNHKRRLDRRENGVQAVSPLSAAHATARLEMACWMSAEAISGQHLTPIRLNPAVATFPDNRVGAPGVPQIRVDMVNDLFCVSSNGNDPWFPNDDEQFEPFTGGNILEHPALKGLHRIGVSLPRFDRNLYRGCRDCGSLRVPEGLPNLEFCTSCIGTWTDQLEQVEQVFLIVPGLPRAQNTDQRHIFRYGENATVTAAVGVQNEDLRTESAVLLDHRLPARGTRRAYHLKGTWNIEDFGTASPEIFYGDGITLYEVGTRGIPRRALQFMWAMSKNFVEDRRDYTYDDEQREFDSVPARPMICGGLVEFKFLSYD